MAKIVIEVDTKEEDQDFLERLLGSIGKVPATRNPLEQPFAIVSAASNAAPGPATPADRDQKPWSTKYDRCVQCHTTERKHFSGGLCSKCYMEKRRLGKRVEPVPLVPPVAGDPPVLTPRQKNANERGEEAKQAKEFMGSGVCQNPNCPYEPNDYRKEDMIVIDGQRFCSSECASEAGKAT